MTKQRLPVLSQIILTARPWLALPLILLATFGGDYRWAAIAAFATLVSASLFIRCPGCGSSIVLIGHRIGWTGTLRCSRIPAPPRPALAGDADPALLTKEPVS